MHHTLLFTEAGPNGSNLRSLLHTVYVLISLFPKPNVLSSTHWKTAIKRIITVLQAERSEPVHQLPYESNFLTLPLNGSPQHQRYNYNSACVPTPNDRMRKWQVSGTSFIDHHLRTSRSKDECNKNTRLINHSLLGAIFPISTKGSVNINNFNTSAMILLHIFKTPK